MHELCSLITVIQMDGCGGRTTLKKIRYQVSLYDRIEDHQLETNEKCGITVSLTMGPFFSRKAIRVLSSSGVSSDTTEV